MPLHYESILRVLYEELECLSRRDRVPCATERHFMEEKRKHQAEWSRAKPDAEQAWISYWAEASLWNNLVSSRYEILKPFPGRPPTERKDRSASATETPPTSKITPNTSVEICSLPAALAPAADETTESIQSAKLKKRREELERELGFVGTVHEGPVISSVAATSRTRVSPSHYRIIVAGNMVGDGEKPVPKPLGASPANIWSLPIDESIIKASKDTPIVFKKNNLKPNSQKSRKYRSAKVSDVPDVSKLGISSATRNVHATSNSPNAGGENSKSTGNEEACKIRSSLQAIFSKPVNSNVEAKYEPSFWDEELGIPRAAAICWAANATTVLWGEEGDAVDTVNRMIGKVVRVLVVLHPLGPNDRFSPLIWQDVHFGYNPHDPDVKVVANWVQDFIDEFSRREEECGSLPDEFCSWARRNFPSPQVRKWLPKHFVNSIARIPRDRAAQLF